MPVSDTTAEAKAVQLQIHRSMSGEQRLVLAFEISLFARELAREGIRQRNPGWSEDLIARELMRIAFLPHPLPAKLPNMQ